MGVGGLQIVHVVGADQRQPEIPGDRRQPAVDEALLFDPVPLHLEKEIVRPQDVAIRCRCFDGLAVLLMREAFGDLALQTAAQADQSLRVLSEQRLVDARLVVEPFGVPGRHQLDQVVVALIGLGEQHEVVLRRARHAAAVLAVTRRHVDFAAEDGVQPARPRVIVKDHRREHVSVLGDRDRRHLQLDGLIQQFVDAARAVEQRELGVQVKVDELAHSHSIVEGGFDEMS